MSNADKWIGIITACAPILVAALTIIPTIISNRKKTQSSIQEMKNELSSEINSTKKEVACVRQDFNDHIDEYDANKAKQARYRILRFYDEVCAGVEHSESHWEDMLDECDFYEVYCETHKEFKNNRGHVAMDYLKETYKKLKAKGKFLTHSDDNAG